ncbi:MAG: CPBP family intramembrane metalloprotease [Planctomycetes bacterium]|nr:CPBP family intramembrane metalloprotease [Planctomycetota bacterium]
MDTSNELPGQNEEEVPTDVGPSPAADIDSEMTDADCVPDAEGSLSGWSALLEMFRRPNIGIAVAWVFVLMVSQVVVGVLSIIAAIVGMVVQGQPINGPNFTKSMEAAVETWLLPVASFSTMVFAFVVVLLLFGRQTARCMGLRGMTVSQIVIILLMAFPMTVLSSEFANLVSHLFPKMEMPEIFAKFAQQPMVLVFCAGCLFPGIGEELFFRGFLGRGLVSRHGVVWGTFFTAFLFGAVHVHPIQASGAFLLGLTLQIVFLTTRSLWGAILLHTANNALAFAAMLYGSRMPVPGFTMASETEIMHTPPLLVLGASIAVGMLLFSLHKTRTQWQLADGAMWSPGFVTAEGPPKDAEVQAVAPWIGPRELVGTVLAYSLFLVTLACSIES